MKFTPYQKRQMLIGGGIGLVLGIFVSMAIYFMIKENPVAFIFIPIATILGLAQAVTSPASKEEKK